MARNSARILDEGDAFPDIEFHLVDGTSTRIPGDWNGSWGLLIVYRGHW